MRKTKAARTAAAEYAPSRRALGFAVLLLTIGGGYMAARPGLQPAEEFAEADDADDASAPTVAEINSHIEEIAARHGVSARLVAAIVAVESEFNPRAVSRKGAQGLMQLMPGTAAGLAVEDSFDARENIEGGVRHLRRLMDRFHNDLPLVLAAYNAGENAVIAHRGIPPYRETRRYVIRVLRRVDREAAREVARRLSGASAATRPRAAPPPRVVPASVAVAIVRFRDVAGRPEAAMELETAAPLRARGESEAAAIGKPLPASYPEGP